VTFLEWLEEAVAAGARLAPACAELGLDPRTVQRWRACGVGDDLRHGPKTTPANKLSAAERRRALDVVNSPAFRDKSPKQIVPILAEQGQYIASESTLYRILREEGLNAHRGPTKPPVRRPTTPHLATGPNQVWSWDITYLKAPIAGSFYYLYMLEDVWSRKVMGFEVHQVECNEIAARLFQRTCLAEGVNPEGLVLHSDNGGPMKGSTMLATLQRLGVVPSFSRPAVSNDNPYSESLFRTLKYRPEYPRGPFASVEAARSWVAGFVRWYNTEHRHSAIRFVTPLDRHSGREAAVLAARQQTYQRARRRNPSRWSRGIRDWTPIREVLLNPERHSLTRDHTLQDAA
jgi:putative transposase